jgi:hypothetical protein
MARLGPHWPLLLVLLAGAGLRLVTMLAYAPGLWFSGDSGIYVRSAYSLAPDPARPLGYSIFLWPLVPFHSVRLIVAVQHLIGLAVAVALYVFMWRRGVRRWVATAAVAVFVLDARTAVLEHFLLAETVYTAVLVAGLLTLCWRERPGLLACGAAGLLLAAASVTRTAGLPLIALAGLYMLVRRVSWSRVATFVVAIAVPLAGYAALNQQHNGDFSLSPYSGRFLWARVSTFVECDRLRLTDRERPLCPPEPLGQRKPADLYLWSSASTPNTQFQGRANDARFASFAQKAILAQPVDYIRTIAVESWLMVRPGGAPDDRYDCFDRVWRMPRTGSTDNCQPQMAPSDPAARRPAMRSGRHDHFMTAPMHGYAKLATVPATVTAGALIFVVGTALWRWRRSRPRRYTGVVSGILVVNAHPDDLGPPEAGTERGQPPDGGHRTLDALLWSLVAFAAVPVAVATSVMEPRYLVPSIPVALVGAALAYPPGRSAALNPRRRQDARHPYAVEAAACPAGTQAVVSPDEDSGIRSGG